LRRPDVSATKVALPFSETLCFISEPQRRFRREIDFYEPYAQIESSILSRRATYQDIPRPVPSVVHLDTLSHSGLFAFRSARTEDSIAEI
jgi:hypothetical protein